MPIIKRYANRKLYDTESKRYVTLEDVADAVRQGEDIKVVDHVTGEDLTSTTLIQILFEEQKKIGGLLPQVFLSRLIRTGGGAVNQLRTRLAAIDPFQVVDEEIRRRLKHLVEQGKLSEDEGQRLTEMLAHRQVDVVQIPVKGEDEDPAGAKPEPVAVEAQPEVQSADIENLQHQVEILEQELQRLIQAQKP